MKQTPARWFLFSLIVVLGLAPVFAGQSSGERTLSSGDGFETSALGLVPTGWRSEIQRSIEESEYDITWQTRTPFEHTSAAWHAPNRAQGSRTYFTPAGFRVIPRVSEQPAWEWGLSLIGYGRGDVSHPVDSASLHPAENRIDLDRGEIVEWFVNEPRGLTHGFVLHGPPEGSHEPIDGEDAIRLDLLVVGNLTPAPGADGKSVRYVSSPGLGVVYCARLEVRDALNRVLPAWMEIHSVSGGWVVRILTNDSKATYPIEVESLVTPAAWSGESNQEGAWFGRYVGSAGDVNADGYDDVIVGVMFFDNGDENEGAAFLYLGSANGPSTTYDWMIDGGEANAWLGRSVDTAGDVNNDGYDDVIVGVPRLNSGAGAWVFHGSSSGLSSEPDWVGQGTPGTRYGYRLGTAGDVNGDGYDDVIVGAYLYGTGGQNTEKGKAYVYRGSASGLLPGYSWTAEGSQPNENFGISVGTAGDINSDGYDDVIVGAWMYDNGENEEGRALVYHGSASGLSAAPDWTYEENVLRACLGTSVGTAGDVNGDGYDDVIVGAPYKSCWDYPTSPAGNAYVFHGSALGLPFTPDWDATLTQMGSMYGTSVATAGDVNGDGYDDVVVGARYYDNDMVDEGAAFLHLGSEAGLSTEQVWMVEGNRAETRFGTRAVTAGDVNGDGLDDVIVGAPDYDNGEEDEGQAFLYLGSGEVAPAGWVPTDTPLLLAKNLGTSLNLAWGQSCLTEDTDYEIYEGQLGDFTSHAPRYCSTSGATQAILLPSDGDTYYLIVPRNQSWEGSYGRTTGGTERPRGTSACLPQAVGTCD